MAYTTINKHTEHFNTKTWTGNASARSFTGIGFAPDLVNTRARVATAQNWWFDKVRGVTKYVAGTSNAAEATNAQSLTSFDSDGFSIGTENSVNYNGDTWVSYNFKANGAGSVDSSTGSISATVSANATAGFSIIKFTNPSSGNFTIPHGLGVAPDMLFFKCTGGVQSWFVLHKDLTDYNNRYLRLHTNAAEITYTMQTQAPTSTLLYLNSGGVSNGNTETICYAFASKTGYSKAGKYIGNGNANGTFVYTGFKPSYVIIKQINADDDWLYYDSGVSPTNVITRAMNHTTSSEATANRDTDFLSNGFKFRSSNGTMNESGATFVYMAFGQSLVGSNNVPCTAR